MTCSGKNLLSGYEESQPGSLVVYLYPTALSLPTLDYMLTRLFIAYGASLQGGLATTMPIRMNGRQVGLYTKQGLAWDSNAIKSAGAQAQ